MEKLAVKLAFKKLDKNSNFVAKSVAWYTRSEYYHVELVVNDIWVSVFPGTGVKLNTLKPLKDTWDYKDLPSIELTKKQYLIFMEFLKEQENKKYDFLGIFLAQVIPLKINNRDKWFCSELVVKLLQMLYVKETFSLVPASTSPGHLEKIFLKG